MTEIDFTTRVVMDDPTKPLTDAERATLVQMATVWAGDDWHPEYADAMVLRFDATVTALTARLTVLEAALREIVQLTPIGASPCATDRIHELARAALASEGQ